MEMISPPPAINAPQAPQATGASDPGPNKDQAQAIDAAVQAGTAAQNAADAAVDAPAAPDGTPVPDGATAPADAAGGVVPPTAAATPADETDTHGAILGGHGSFAPLRPESLLGLLPAENHRGIDQDVPSLHLFQAAGTVDATHSDVNTLANAPELRLVLQDDLHDEPAGPINHAPDAAADSYEMNHDSTLSVAANGVLDNDSDSESDPLTAVLVHGPAHGSLTFNADGSFSYTPESGFSGTDTFTYHANDGHAASGAATVSITIVDGNDYLTGTPDHDVLNGGLGDDVLYGLDCGDELNGGADDDQIYGGQGYFFDITDGNDTIDAGTGNDHAYGGLGNDSISGGEGNDWLYGNTQSYYPYPFYYGNDNDVINGGTGADHIYGGTGNDTIYGGEGDDYIAGNTDYSYYYYYGYYYTVDNDWIDSGAGNDTINCASNNNYYPYYYGYNTDNDTISISSLDGHDVIQGFDGNPMYGQDVVTLDSLFDTLGVATEDRAGRVQIDNVSSGVWNVSVDADGNSANGCEALVAQIQSSDSITVGQDVLVGLAA